MTCGIYSISDLDGNCLYIGLSRNIEVRWKGHLKQLKNGTHPQSLFVDWFKSNGGSEGLAFKILEDCAETLTDAQLNSREIEWFTKTTPRFFSKVPSTNEKWKHSQETKEKIRSTINKNFEQTRLSRKRECLWCGSTFSPPRKQQRFCSTTCSSRSRGKLSDADRIEIVRLYPAMSQDAIAAKYKVNQVAIHRVLKQA